MRFCVIRMNVDRKMASTEAAMARTTYVGSKCGRGTPGRFARIHRP
jgi:hypothetical protein